MNRISILDCTLRDGGYINNWQFGRETIQGIVRKLDASGVEIVECGFLRDVPYNEDTAVFSSVSQIAPLLPKKRADALYVAMIAYGDIPADLIEPYDGRSIDGIRLTFHKHEWAEARAMAVQLKGKGYQVFIQPVGTTAYSDSELLGLIAQVNELQPFAFYLVDTLGILYRNDLLRLFYLIENNLDSQIQIGFHSHNNLQLSFANAQELLRLNSKRDIIIDASVYGMGRGVGNLPTELFAEYINANVEQRYSITPLLSIADQYLMSIYTEQRWGYDLPYFLSAVEGCHPNYAAHLLRKETLNVEDISKILSLIPKDRRDLYHPELIETLYLETQAYQIDDSSVVEMLKAELAGRSVLILAPGATLRTYTDAVRQYVESQDIYTVAINFCPTSMTPNLLFLSNRKRLNTLQDRLHCIPAVMAASNLIDELPGDVRFVNYISYLGEGRAADNAGAMLVRVLKKAGAVRILLAGFDGFDVDSANNYCVDSYRNVVERRTAEEKNQEIAQQLKLALNGISYEFVTPTRYQLT